MMDYETLKALAKEMKRPAKSLLALSANNDPFYCGMDAQVEESTSTRTGKDHKRIV